MKSIVRKDLPIIAVVLLPFIYLAYIWNDLPEEVPLHWNIRGDVDKYGSKFELLLIPILLPLLVYLIFLIVPKIDPKNKIQKMGGKYQSLKAILTIFMSGLALFIMYAANNESVKNPNYIVLIIGLLFVFLGNYFKTIKPNYFIGIKTPWTLENETVWKETHSLAGKMWFVGGLIIVFSSLILSKEANFTLFTVITVIIASVPVIYSYIFFKQLEKGV
jgi:uncharacterized membrane protein